MFLNRCAGHVEGGFQSGINGRILISRFLAINEIRDYHAVISVVSSEGFGANGNELGGSIDIVDPE